MRAIVIRHHEEDSAGFIGEAFAARGAELSVHLFPDAGPLPDPARFDHIIVLGSSYSVYDQDPARAWIADELAWLQRADRAGVPVLGICFGAQVLVAALGGRVVPAARKEIGWFRIDTLDPGLIPAGPWLEFHGDQCLLPPSARLLACSSTFLAGNTPYGTFLAGNTPGGTFLAGNTPYGTFSAGNTPHGIGVQAFAAGRHLGVQFHPEVGAAQLAGWMQASARAEAEAAGVDPAKLLAETAAEEPAARDRAARLVAAALRLAAAG
ncbi:MAG TPA: gamma-glutamyl-gamma-aminobutyrate hydrolase family protein [Streptosporangiaceae bacterium]|jgi:GMP synthase-like glutamine amidotransferase